MRISKKAVSDQEWEVMWNHLISLLHSASSTDQLELLLKNLLPPAERIMLAKRLMVGVLSLAGWSAIEISQSLKLSKATTYKFIALLEHSDAYRELLEPIVATIPSSETKPDDEPESKGIWSKIW